MPKKLLITAGPTREMLDPVRFLSNLSTGEMGYTLAQIARAKKYQVTLISGPTALKPPRNVKFIPVISAEEMKKACRKYFSRHDALIMTAAVCDFTSAEKAPHKIRRTHTKQLLLKQTPDIVAGIARKKGKRIVIGFCLETQDWLQNAVKKLKRKNLDGIVANYYNKKHYPFGDRKITTVFINKEEQKQVLTRQSKKQIAVKLLRWLESIQKNSLVNR